ncbi:S66 family peptidase [Virgibacillus chiguensis]|uniref:Muramoyltetrapeptide carboxypeptidase LdcA (Peptidoglycan recycling) n=1 Tax=Virgibacillus chiguensis TaxID=411959 RepID=A0A1M5VX28_9BACI|nr:S66 peptidase family protein [Virgibacillus chiguensis]SHH79534.1 Muramoyltetrapeptide carboxypeptidase LdcA (peptidoglycan recycling) [Virgibacillus chiguensis]
MLMKPNKLQKGDRVATVSPSWGGAGEAELRYRYEIGVRRLEEVFGLEVVPMPNSLKGAAYVYENPQARAEDLMQAFQEPTIKAIIANIGGEDSIRLLPYIDFTVIRNHPKIFMGYSDATMVHLFCYKAGLSSFYGPAILTDFAENVEMHEYTIDFIERTLFSRKPIGKVEPAKEWTSEFLDWFVPANSQIKRSMQPNNGYELLQGKGIVSGHLIGGCMEVLEFAKGTELWPKMDHWKDGMLFFETSEEKPSPDHVKRWLRNYAAQGILHVVNGMIFAKPQQEKYYEEYKTIIGTVLQEYDLEHLPVLFNLNFGHTEPKFILPYGAMAEMNCEAKTFSILESGVQ